MTQEQAMAILKTGANVFLTGEPGSGKTHTVNRYVAYLRSHGIEPAPAASTSVAEVSMLEARTVDMVAAACRAVRRAAVPFGGLQVVFVGDFFQLPPVVRDGRTAGFAFRLSAWAGV